MTYYGSKRRRWYHWLVYQRKLSVIDRYIQTQLISKVRDSIILYGNANFNPSFGRGRPAGPRKLLIRRMWNAYRGKSADGYRIHLICVNEAYSSMTCPKCFGRTRPGYGHWQLKHCPKLSCPVRWQRDHAGSLNILTIMLEFLKTGQRPAAFCRPKGQLAKHDNFSNA